MNRLVWLALAGLLLFVAVWLMHGGPKVEPAVPTVAPRIPRFPTPEERRRRIERAKIVVPAAPGEEEPRRFQGPERLDPLFVALSNPHGAVLEASAVLHSEIGQAVFGCLSRQDDFQKNLETFEAKAGFKLNDLDRVAFDGDVMVVSAHRRSTPDVEGAWTTVAEDARMSVDGARAVGLFGDDLMVVGPQASVESTLRRLSGEEPPQESLPSEIAYGEIYGRADAEILAALFPPGEGDRAAIRDAIQGVEFHFDVREDVAMYFEVSGDQHDALDDVAKSLAGALSLARMNAAVAGDTELKQLLDLTRIGGRSAGHFTLDVVLPKEFVLERLELCARDARPETPGPRPGEDG